MRPENQRIANQAARTILTSNALFRHAPVDGGDARPVRIDTTTKETNRRRADWDETDVDPEDEDVAFHQ